MVRVKGTLRRWDDARGFGFIEPDLGGTLVFVHIKAFSFDLPERPQVGQRISYELAPDRQGGERASRAVIELPVAAARSPVRPPARAAVRAPAAASDARSTARVPHQRRPARPLRPTEWGVATLFLLPLAVVGYAVAAHLWALPGWVGGWFIAASLVNMALYAQDKAAARARRWRTPEAKLHLVSLLGGWPGALLAQQLWRHKTSKAAFRSTFWATVLGNVGAFVLLCSPLRRLIA